MMDPEERWPSGALKKNKPPVHMLDAESLAKRRAENRKHAQASRKRVRDTYEKLVIESEDLRLQVQQEKELNLVLRQQMHDAWKQQQTMLMMRGIPVCPMPVILTTPPPSLIDHSLRGTREPPLEGIPPLKRKYTRRKKKEEKTTKEDGST